MGTKTFNLGKEGRRKINTALERYLEMKEADRKALIDDIEETGCFRVFGYASLIGDPHAKADEQHPGILRGLRRDAVFSDRYYRGRPHHLGVTMGVIPAGPKEKVHGVMLVIRGKQGESDFTDRIVSNIYQFAQRETSLNPIYAYQVREVEGAFGRAKAVICGTDESMRQYIGPTVRAGGGRYLTIREKAAIIASSSGVPGASPRNTGLSYWRYVLDCDRKSGVKTEPHIEEMVRLANAYRLQLPEHLKRKLERMEDDGALGRGVFAPRKRALRTGTRTVMRYRYHARLKLGIRDPLPPNRLKIVERNKRELKQALAA